MAGLLNADIVNPNVPFIVLVLEAIIGLAVPLLTALFSMLLLGETMTPVQGVGAALMDAGRLEEARAGLAEFRRRFPDYVLPASLRDGILR